MNNTWCSIIVHVLNIRYKSVQECGLYDGCRAVLQVMYVPVLSCCFAQQLFTYYCLYLDLYKTDALVYDLLDSALIALLVYS